MERATKLLFILLLGVVATGPAVAEQETEVQRRACEPDVWRLCSTHIPDRDAITACLQRNYQKLSPACRAVFDGTLK